MKKLIIYSLFLIINNDLIAQKQFDNNCVTSKTKLEDIYYQYKETFYISNYKDGRKIDVIQFFIDKVDHNYLQQKMY